MSTPRQRTKSIFNRMLEPSRVFIAVMIAAVLYLFPSLYQPVRTEVKPIEHGLVEVQTAPYDARAQGPNPCGSVRCDPGYCCIGGYCQPIGQCIEEEPPSPPTITGSLNCTNWGSNDWCIGSLSIDFSASDPQGATLLIWGAIDGELFSCAVGASSCSLALPTPGTGNVEYRVDASSTGLSDSDIAYYKLDTSTPDLNGTISGVVGNNGWYRSNVTITAFASDSISGLAFIEASIDSAGWTSYYAPITIADGIHTWQLKATDNAGNTTETSQSTVQVDTISPSLSLSISGTNGKNGWYKSNVTVIATASDSGSGIATVEAMVDSGAWSPTSQILMSDGVHSYQFRVTDIAGNVTTTPSQTINIDTIAPFIDMTTELDLGEYVYYNIEDYGSGLSIYRAVIEDDEERYQKIVWLENIGGEQIVDKILWDGKFKDGTQAGAGEYLITLKISDAAGNERMKTAIVTVDLLSFLQDIPAFTPPASSTLLSEEEDAQETGSTQQGDDSQTDPSSSTTIFGNEPIVWGEGDLISSGFSVSSETTATTPITTTDILFGAAAAALIGATLAEWEKQREAERKRRERAEMDAQIQKNKLTKLEAQWQAEKNAQTIGQQAVSSLQQTLSATQLAALASQQAVTLHNQGEKDYIPTPSSNASMPAGISPTTQAAFTYGGSEAQSWINSNAGQLVQEYAQQQENQSWLELIKSYVNQNIVQPASTNTQLFVENLLGASTWLQEQIVNPTKQGISTFITNTINSMPVFGNGNDIGIVDPPLPPDDNFGYINIPGPELGWTGPLINVPYPFGDDIGIIDNPLPPDDDFNNGGFTPLPPETLDDLVLKADESDADEIDNDNSTLEYEASPKHDPRYGWGSEMDLDDETAQEVLNDGVQDGKQVYSFYNGNVYVFQPNNAGTYHGYISNDVIPTTVLRIWRDEGIISQSEYNKMLKWSGD